MCWARHWTGDQTAESPIGDDGVLSVMAPFDPSPKPCGAGTQAGPMPNSSLGGQHGGLPCGRELRRQQNKRLKYTSPEEIHAEKSS
jgi:hypothetical protein